MNADGMEILRRYKDDIAVLAPAKAYIECLVTSPINENQRAALESFVVCQGSGILRTSDLLKFVNLMPDVEYTEQAVFFAADEFYNPIYSTRNGKISPKLEKRREMESKLFLKPICIKGAK